VNLQSHPSTNCGDREGGGKKKKKKIKIKIKVNLIYARVKPVASLDKVR
jgi:hypothetical protein